ncbi:MAG TPA: HEAT repeat domain-containing protein, partial [Chthonomonadaceae bacterium]|nr:HEAT repeat domain-containing protein [Chthonomonadaceae bacterium]
MLKPDQAQARLHAFLKPDGKGRRLERAKTLPAPLKEIALALHGLDAEGKSFKDTRTHQEAQGLAMERLESLTGEERAALFESLFPGIARHVEGAWQLFARLPYQTGHVRKAFRARDVGPLVNAARKNWLLRMLKLTQGYEQDVAWYTAWAPYLNQGWGADPLGILFAAAIEAGGAEGEAVFNILLDSARGEHEIGAMGRHVSRALLVASRPEGWEFIEKMLLAAQRQEGLRQVILEAIDEAHPQAFRRMLRLIIANDLLRFSATVRAVYVWFGFDPEAVNVRQGSEMLQQVARCLEDADARAAALCGEDSQLRFLALWTLAFEDAGAAIGPAAQMLADPKAEHRLAAVRLLALLGLPAAQKTLLVALEDPDLRVVEAAFTVFRYGVDASLQGTDLFERLERLLPRFPKERQSEVAAALAIHLGDRSPKRLLPYLSLMEPYLRRSLAQMLAKEGETDAECRETLFALTGDPSPDVRECTLKIIAQYRITEAEVQKVERLLTRKASDLRRGVLSLLMKQDDTHALTSADRLLAAGDAGQRLAGLELLREMTKAGRAPDRCRQRAARYLEERPLRTGAEEELIAAFLTPETEVPTQENGLGLYDPAQRTQPVTPCVIPGLAFATEASVALLQSLDEVIHAHRESPVVLTEWSGRGEQMLGNLNWQFPGPRMQTSLEVDIARLPLVD